MIWGVFFIEGMLFIDGMGYFQDFVFENYINGADKRRRKRIDCYWIVLK